MECADAVLVLESKQPIDVLLIIPFLFVSSVRVKVTSLTVRMYIFQHFLFRKKNNG
jgi:hypothetical protein